MSCCIVSPPSLLLSSSTAASVDLRCRNSFHGVFVLSSQHMAVPSQSGLSYFVRNAYLPSVFRMTSFLLLSFSDSETPSIDYIILISVLYSSLAFPLSLLMSRPLLQNFSTGLITVLHA